jgi:hypothetical protein
MCVSLCVLREHIFILSQHLINFKRATARDTQVLPSDSKRTDMDTHTRIWRGTLFGLEIEELTVFAFKEGDSRCG